MIEYLLTIIIIITLTALAFRKNSVAMLSLSFTLIYVIEVALYYINRNALYDFFLTFGARYPLSWGIITAIYVHSLSPGHVFFNILFFFLAGMPFESRIGSKRFTAIFMISGIAANIGYSLYLHAYGVNSVLIGASGAIFGIMGAFIIMYPEERIAMFLGPILLPRIKVKYAILTLLLTEFLMSMLWIQDSVAHGAHVIGALTGAIIGYYLKNHGTAERKEIDYESLKKLADSEKLMEIYSKIEAEDDPVIRNMWIDKFLKEKFRDFRISGKYIEKDGKKYRIYR